MRIILLAATGAALLTLTACASDPAATIGGRSATSATSVPSGAIDTEDIATEPLNGLEEAAEDAVDAVGRGAVVRATWTGSAWDLVVGSHSGEEWDVRSLPSSSASATPRAVAPEQAEFTGRTRTVLDTAPTLDERVEDIVGALRGAAVRSIVLTEHGGDTVWQVEADGAEPLRISATDARSGD